MSKYIEFEAVLKKIKKLQKTERAMIGKKQFTDGYFCGLDEAEIILRQAPAADVKEVVKCKDCKHRYEPVNCALWYATYDGKEYFRDHGGEFSCSFGERKGAAVHGDPIPAEASGEI